jgi:hypothetical protein
MAFDVRMPDGTLIRNVPEGTTQEEILSRYNASQQSALQQQPVSMTERMFGAGSPTARFLKGAIVDPLLGANQLLAETGLFGDTVRQQARGNVRAVEQAVQEGRQRVGSEGFDFVQLAGNIVSPINRIAPTAAAPTALGRVGQASGTGLLFGGVTPVVNTEDYLSEKLTQLGTGAIAGALIGSGVESAKKASKVVKDLSQPLTESGRREALREYLRKLTGPEQEKVISALRSTDELVQGSRPTAAEAVSDIPTATGIAAYQRRLAGSMPEEGIAGQFAQREAQQQTARMNALGQVSKGGDEAIAAAVAQREAATAPLREQALTQANIAGQLQPRLDAEIASKFQSKAKALQAEGQLATEASQQVKIAENFTPVPGLPRFPARYTENLERVAGNLEGAKTAGNIARQRQAEIDFKKFQLQSLADNGFYPLESQPIVSKIQSVLSKPGERASDVVTNVLGSLRSKLQQFTDEATGVIDSRDLYTIRKEIGNDIRKFAQESQNWDSRLTAKLEGNIKSYIDNAIEQAGGADWKKYLSTYAAASDKINRLQIGQFLEQKLGTTLGNKERAGVFANAVQEAASTIKRATGQPRFGKLEDVLTKEEVTSVNKVLADVQRKAKAEELASQSNVGSLIQDTAELPNLLNRYATLTNTVLKALKKDSNADINRLAAEMMLDPRKLAAFIEGVPQSNSKQVVTAMMKRLTPDNRDLFARYLTIQGATQSVIQPEGE